eukprot:1160127-Pelagomonas_calceolata.AAC.2
MPASFVAACLCVLPAPCAVHCCQHHVHCCQHCEQDASVRCTVVSTVCCARVVCLSMPIWARDIVWCTSVWHLLAPQLCYLCPMMLSSLPTHVFIKRNAEYGMRGPRTGVLVSAAPYRVLSY